MTHFRPVLIWHTSDTFWYDTFQTCFNMTHFRHSDTFWHDTLQTCFNMTDFRHLLAWPKPEPFYYDTLKPFLVWHPLDTCWYDTLSTTVSMTHFRQLLVWHTSDNCWYDTLQTCFSMTYFRPFYMTHFRNILVWHTSHILMTHFRHLLLWHTSDTCCYDTLQTPFGMTHFKWNMLGIKSSITAHWCMHCNCKTEAPLCNITCSVWYIFALLVCCLLSVRDQINEPINPQHWLLCR